MCGHSRRRRNIPKVSIRAEPKEQSDCQHTLEPKIQQSNQQRQDIPSQDSLIAHLQQRKEEPLEEAEPETGGPSRPYESSLPLSTAAHLAQQELHHDVQEYELLHGDENFLVGITPQYWAHVPMLIGDIQHLTLSKGGINFWNQIPVSKCLLVGRIVSSKPSSENAMMYVLDDGTGLMDCITYHNHNHDDYELPSLLPFNKDNDNDQQQSPIALGTCVKIFGKIKNLAISHGRVLREINAQIMEPVHESFGNRYNPEHEHWIQCAKFYDQAFESPTTTTTFQPLGCLETLGNHIQSQVRAKRRLPSADDTLGAWRIFGMECQCTCSQSIKDSLLYCHCQAKVILKTDPQFQYKQALLQHLLENQTKHVKMFVFGYQDLKQEEALFQVAMEQASKSTCRSGNQNHNSTTRKRFFHEELLRATVRALVKDGILFHIDPDNDQYLLITREKVLEPFVRDELNRPGNTKNFVSLKGAPNYLNGVDLEKFLYIKRCLLLTHNSNNNQNNDENIHPKRQKR